MLCAGTSLIMNFVAQCTLFDLSLFSMLGLSDWGILGMQRRRLSKYLTRVHEDDMHLIAERKGAKLSQSGLSEALWERGL